MSDGRHSRHWMIWAFVPYLSGIAFIIGGQRARSKSWERGGWLLLVPSFVAIALSGTDTPGVDAFDIALDVVVALWFGAMFAVLRLRNLVDAEAAASSSEAPPISPPEDTVPTHGRPWGEPAVRPPSPPARYTPPRHTPPHYTPPRPSAPRAPRAGDRCPRETSASGQPKVVFADEADALRFMEKNRHRYSFDHAYECPYFDHWHLSSTAARY